jgi:hypothetical protein
MSLSSCSTGLGEGLEAVLHELRDAAAENSLLAEQVGLGLFGERGLDAAGAQAADGLGVRPGEIPGGAGRVLLDGDDDGNATAGLVLAANRVARALGGDEQHVDAGGRGDVAVADVEAVAEDERLALGEVGGDVVGVQVTLALVGREDDDDVGPCGGLGTGENGESGFFGLLLRLRAFLQPDDDLDTGVAEVLRVRVALRAVADDGDLLALDECEVGVFVVEDFSHFG